jgi:hypothetical protein
VRERVLQEVESPVVLSIHSVWVCCTRDSWMEEDCGLLYYPRVRMGHGKGPEELQPDWVLEEGYEHRKNTRPGLRDRGRMRGEGQSSAQWE